MNIGQMLQQARERAGMTQEAAAEQIGVSRQTLSNWENNKSYPDIARIVRLSNLYSISVDELLKQDSGMMDYLEESTNVVKSRQRIFRRLIFVAYLFLWLLMILLFQIGVMEYGLFDDPMIFYWMLPVPTLLCAVLIGLDGDWKKGRWGALLVIGCMPLFAESITVELVSDFPGEDMIAMLMIGLVSAATGLGIGILLRKTVVRLCRTVWKGKTNAMENAAYRKRVLLVAAALSVVVLACLGYRMMQSAQPPADNEVVKTSADIQSGNLGIGDVLPAELSFDSSVSCISRIRNKADAIAVFQDELDEPMQAVWFCRKPADGEEYTVCNVMTDFGSTESESVPPCVWYDSEPENGTSYTYKLLCRTAEDRLIESNEVTICRLDRPQPVEVNDLFTSEWTENTEADGYELRYATDGDFSDSQTCRIAGHQNTGIPQELFPEGKKYWVKVRAYKMVGDETYYSSWMHTETVTAVAVQKG